MTDEYDPFAAEGPAGDDGLVAVDLEFETLRDFREKMAPYLGDRGFFARSEKPLARNTPVRFRFVLPEGFALAQGTATVAWTIDPESNPDLIPGMALRFVEVGRQSRAVIRELVDFHIATGGDAFDLGPAGSEPGEIPTDALDAGALGPDPDADFSPPSARPGDGAGPASGAGEEVLPDWLAESVDPSRFDFDDGGAPVRDDLEPAAPAAAAEEASPGEFEVDMIFDDNEGRGARAPQSEGSARGALQMTSSGHEPPRDLRLGLIVAAALAVVAVVVLVWSLWLRPQPTGEAAAVEVAEEAARPGVAILPDPPEPEETLSAEAPTKIFVAEEPPSAGVIVEEAAAVPQPTAAAAQNPGQRADRILDIVAAARERTTTVVIRGNGLIGEEAVRISRLDDPARIWVRIRHIETFYRPNEIPVGSPEVLRVRVGHHPEEAPPSLWVVVDLADEAMAVTAREFAGDTVRLSVGRP